MVKVIFFDLGETLVTATRQWLPGAKAVVAQLRLQGFRLGIISNTGTFTRQQLLNDQLPTDFSFSLFENNLILLSSEVHLEKPDLKIFRKAIEQAHVDAAQCLFCTEDLRHTLAAQRTGMLTARLQKPPLSEIATLAADLLWMAQLA